jgi:hypothetical protein
MANKKRSSLTPEPTSSPATPRKRRRSAAQSPTTHKSPPPIHYEIDTKYGRLVCDYDVSTALAIDEQGNEVAAIVKAIRDRFEEDLATISKRPEFASWVEAHAGKEGITNEQAEQELRSVLISLHTSAAWFEFTQGLQIAIKNAVSQQFEMSIIVAKIQHGGLEPKIGVVADRIIELVKQQIEQRIKFPHIGGGPLVNLAWEYFVCLIDWQEAKRIYRRKRNSTSWRKMIKDEYPDLPDDLIEWLALSENKSDLEADAFQNLPDDARHRLNDRIEKKGYRLSMPSEIALEHAARLCGSPPYSYSIFRLKNIKSEHAEEAERAGVRHYLKNTQSMHSHQSYTIED